MFKKKTLEGVSACSSGSEGSEAASALLQLAGSALDGSPTIVEADDISHQTTTNTSSGCQHNRGRKSSKSNRPLCTQRMSASVIEPAAFGTVDESSMKRLLKEYEDLSTDALTILKTFFNTQTLNSATALLSLSYPATLVPLLLLRCGIRGGIGGRLKREDPHLDPTVDPRKAGRVFNNRLAAARSKLKQKMAKKSLELLRLHKLQASVHAVVYGSSSSLRQHQYSSATCDTLAKELIAILGFEDRIPNAEQQDMIKQVEQKVEGILRQLELMEKQIKSISSMNRELAAAMNMQQVEVQQDDGVEVPTDPGHGGLAVATGIAAAAAATTPEPHKHTLIGDVTSLAAHPAAVAGSSTVAAPAAAQISAVTLNPEPAEDGSDLLRYAGTAQTSVHQYQQQQQGFQADAVPEQAWQPGSCQLTHTRATSASPPPAVSSDDEHVDTLRSSSSSVSSNSGFASAAAACLQQPVSLLKRCSSCSGSESLSGMADCEVSRESGIRGEFKTPTVSAEFLHHSLAMPPPQFCYAAHGMCPAATFGSGCPTDHSLLQGLISAACAAPPIAVPSSMAASGPFGVTSYVSAGPSSMAAGQDGTQGDLPVEGLTSYPARPIVLGPSSNAPTPRAVGEMPRMAYTAQYGRCDAEGVMMHTATAAGAAAAAAGASGAFNRIQAQVPSRPNHVGYHSLMHGWTSQAGVAAADVWCSAQQQQQHLANSSHYLQYSNAARVLYIPEPTEEAVASSAYAVVGAAQGEAEAAAAKAAAVAGIKPSYDGWDISCTGFNMAAAATATATDVEKDTIPWSAAKASDQDDVNIETLPPMKKLKRSNPVDSPSMLHQVTTSRVTVGVPNPKPELSSATRSEAPWSATIGDSSTNILYECDNDNDVIMILADCGLGSSDAGGSLLSSLDCQLRLLNN